LNFKLIFPAFAKPILGEELAGVIHFHPTDLSMEDFHRDFLAASCLPVEYGGDLESIEILHSRNREDLMQMREYFSIEERLMNFELEGCDLGVK
jgi:hypothetical protein